MSGTDSLHILDLEATIKIVENALATMTKPFMVRQVVGYESVTVERTDVIDRIGKRLILQRTPEIQQREITDRVSVVVNFDNIKEVTLNVVENMVMSTFTSFVPYETTWEVTVAVAAVIFKVHASEVTENQIWIAEALLESPLMNDAFVDIQHQLAFIQNQRWRYWRPMRYGDMFMVIGGKDYRVHTYEKLNGTDDDEYTLDIAGPLRYLEERARRRNLFDERELPHIVRMLFVRALRSEVSNIYIRLEHTVPVAFEYYRLFHIQVVIPLARIFARETIEKQLPKRLSCVVEGRLEGEKLTFVFQSSDAKYNEEREDILDAIENQDYVPPSLRRHYRL